MDLLTSSQGIRLERARVCVRIVSAVVCRGVRSELVREASDLATSRLLLIVKTELRCQRTLNPDSPPTGGK